MFKKGDEVKCINGSKTLRLTRGEVYRVCNNEEKGMLDVINDDGVTVYSYADRFELVSGEKSEDPVNHPPHYKNHPSGIECIEIVRHFNYNIGNCVKYLWRHGLKDPEKTIEDLEKAKFYIEDEIKKLKTQKSCQK